MIYEESKRIDKIQSRRARHWVYLGTFQADISTPYIMDQECSVNAIIAAEEEAEERHAKALQELKDKAVEAHIDLCPHRNEMCVDFFACAVTKTQCMDLWCKQDYVKHFTQKLNEQ